MPWMLTAARGEAVHAHTLIATDLRHEAEHMQVASVQEPPVTGPSPASPSQATPQH